MNSNEFDQFCQLMNMASEYYGKPHLTEMAMNMYFNGLSDRSFEQVQYAFNCHVKDPEGGKFFPKVADFERHLTAPKLTTDAVLAHARNPRDAFGIRCMIQIGSYDLKNNTDSFYLKQRAQECIELAPEWEQEALEGDYGEYLISAMVKRGIDPRRPFRDGLPTPRNLEGISRVMRIVSDKHNQREALLLEDQSKIERTPEQIAESKKRIQEIVANLGFETINEEQKNND